MKVGQPRGRGGLVVAVPLAEDALRVRPSVEGARQLDLTAFLNTYRKIGGAFDVTDGSEEPAVVAGDIARKLG